MVIVKSRKKSLGGHTAGTNGAASRCRGSGSGCACAGVLASGATSDAGAVEGAVDDGEGASWALEAQREACIFELLAVGKHNWEANVIGEVDE